MSSRLYIAFVSLLGSFGLASALVYLAAIAVSFLPGGARLSAFMIGSSDDTMRYGFLLFLVPYVAILTHLYLRIRLGHWLVERGELDAAIAYCSRRVRPNLFRARKEATSHSIALARAHASRGDYAKAAVVLDEAPAPRGAFGVELQRWRLEIALRQEDLVRAHQVVERAGTIAGRTPEVAAYFACVGELAVREGDRDAFDEAIQNANWARRQHPRLDYTRAQGALRFGMLPHDFREGLRQLERAQERVVRELPLRQAELEALRSLLLLRAGDVDEARTAVSFALNLEADGRARFVLREAEKALAEARDDDG